MRKSTTSQKLNKVCENQLNNNLYPLVAFLLYNCIMINYTDELRQHNLKATPQRLAIADALHVHGHINIESLYEMMVKKFSSISLATIYKNINIMLENSFIKEVKIPNAKSVYELTKHAHSHMVCKKCADVEDITLDLHKVVEKASNNSNFKIEQTDLVLSGICKKCQDL